MSTAIKLCRKAPSLASIQDKDGNLPLHILFFSFGGLSIHETSIKLAAILIEATSDLNVYNVKNLTPLLTAASSGNSKAIRLAV